MLPTKLPTVMENKARLMLYAGPHFTIYGDLYSDKRMFLHLDWPDAKMTPSIMKEGIRAIAMIKNGAAASGIKYLNVLVPEDLVKFESLWGFSIVNVYISDNLPPLVHMMQETN